VGARPEISRIVLVGFMGSGKTSVGAALARLLGWSFRDLDEWIEAQAGLSVARVFDERGEPAFRALERDAARATAGLVRHVIASGGGSFADPEARHALAEGAVSVHLRCGLETALARLPEDGRRPLARNRERMQALFSERQPAYRLADVSVDAETGGPEEVAARVARELGLL
jgi:shikimate kinase